MIRVTIELIPHGVGEPKKLSVIEIANDGTGTDTRANYKARIRQDRPWDENVLVNWPRKAYTVKRLLYEVLKYYYGSK